MSQVTNAGRAMHLPEPALSDELNLARRADVTTGDGGPFGAIPSAIALDGLYDALEGLHAQRREMLLAKRNREPSFRQDEYDELVRYIRQLERPIQAAEERQNERTVEKLEQISERLLAAMGRK